MIPVPPNAKPEIVPLFVSVNETPYKVLVVPLVRGDQLSPPLVVLRITPPSPTAVPVLPSVNETLKRHTVPGFAWVVHVLPPSVVLTIVLSPPIPQAPPTAVAVFVSMKEIPNNVFPVPLD